MNIDLPALLMQKIGHHLRQSGDLEAVQMWTKAIADNYRRAVDLERHENGGFLLTNNQQVG